MEPWLNTTTCGLAGGIFGMIIGLHGALSGIFAPKGLYKSYVLGSLKFLLAGSAILLCAGITGYFVGQPYDVWYFLILSGLIGCISIFVALKCVTTTYRNIELRKIEAQNLP